MLCSSKLRDKVPVIGFSFEVLLSLQMPGNSPTAFDQQVHVGLPIMLQCSRD